MTIPTDFLDTMAFAATRHPGPRIMLCPRPGDLSGLKPFIDFAEWREFVLGFALHAGVPDVVIRKFERAQKEYITAWFDPDFMLSGEHVALMALDLAMRDCYGLAVQNRRGDIYFSRLVGHMVEKDALTDEGIPMARKLGVSIVQNLYETQQARESRKHNNVAPPMTLVESRNQQMHGYPDSLPRAGLLELSRDLIQYTYRRSVVLTQAI